MIQQRRAWIGLGANLGAPALQLKRALRRLDAEASIQLEACSAFYRSPAMTLDGDPVKQPDYCNAVARLRTELEADALLAVLLRVEQDLGRERNAAQRWQARTLDLDLLWMQGQQLDLQHLTIPHPGITERNFVLQPWADLDPCLAVSGLGQVARMLSKLGADELPSWQATHALS